MTTWPNTRYSLLARLADADDGAAWQAFEETVVALRRNGLVHGLAIMTFEMDPGLDIGQRIVAALRAAGIALDPPVGEQTISPG